MAKHITRRKFLGSTAVGIAGSAVASAGASPKQKGGSPAALAKATAAERTSSSSHDIRHYATIEAHANGEPVYAFGYTYVYAVSPDLQPGVQLQDGNKHPWNKRGLSALI
jgi:hypothetical protein